MKCRSSSLVLAVPGILFAALNAMAATPSAGSAIKPLQFTSGGHILGFTSQDLVVATGSHALRVEFVGATSVVPAAEGAAATAESTAAPLTRVTYPGLWEGIALAYDGPPGGLLRSTYTLDTGADPSKIRLRYNAPLVVESGGGLRILFATGAMHESAPVAWQDIDGRRVAVTVAFRRASETEVGFQLGPYDKSRPLTIDPTLTWNTFIGGAGDDFGNGIALDANGNIYVTGDSYDSWGTPIREFAGSYDAFVAKFDADGALAWNTFLGSSAADYSRSIAVDADDNVYITGSSGATWGNPILAFVGTTYGNAYVAKLDTNGALQWNTFFGTTSDVSGFGIAVEADGTVYVTGWCGAAWGTPIREFAGSYDAFVAKLGTGGVLAWHTFLGGADQEYGNGIAVDAVGDVYVTGWSNTTWGAPIREFSGNRDAFVAKLGTNGDLTWNTFLGGALPAEGSGIAVEANGTVFVTGKSRGTWGNPIREFGGENFDDAFVARLTTGGALEWNTFLGAGLTAVGRADDSGYGIAVDASGNAYVTGMSYAGWGNPIREFVEGEGDTRDAFVAKLDTNGNLSWNTFLGGTGEDLGNGIAVDADGIAFVSGWSYATWGAPILAFLGAESWNNDAFVARIENDIVVPPASTVTITADDPTATEAGMTTGQYTVTRTGATTAALTVNYVVTGTATRGSDYTGVGTSVTIPAGDVNATIIVTPKNDAAVEGDETVIVSLSADAAYTVGSPASATVTIFSDDVALPIVTITATDATATEAGTTTGEYTVTRTGATTAALTVNFAVTGTATSRSDYTAIGTSVTIPAGAANATIIVTPKNDTAVESEETVIVSLSADETYTVGHPASATVTIASDDVVLPIVTISATDATATEAGTTTGLYTVMRTGATTAALTVNYVVNGTATPGSDYTGIGTSVTIPAGAANATINVTPNNDTDVESDETVIVSLIADAAYTVGSPASATVTIASDDLPTVTISATDATATEVGPTTGMFTVTRTGSPIAALAVNYTAGGSATTGVDYVPLSGSVTIDAGSGTATITVTPVNDTVFEIPETVVVNLSADAAYTVGTLSSATATITSDEGPPKVQFSRAASSGSEATTPAVINAILSVASSQTVTVQYATANGTAAAGSDYAVTSGILIFSPGETSRPIKVPITGDTAVEPNETFMVTLATPVNATLGTIPRHIRTIANDDFSGSIRLSSATYAVGEAGPTVTITATRTAGSSGTVGVRYATANGTATAGEDYASAAGKLSWADGDTRDKTILVPIVNDTLDEPDETFSVKLSAPTGGAKLVLSSGGTVTIIDNDPSPTGQ